MKLEMAADTETQQVADEKAAQEDIELPSNESDLELGPDDEAEGLTD